MFAPLRLVILSVVFHLVALAAVPTTYAPVFASWPSSTAQIDGAVPAFSTGESEALVVVNTTYTYYVVVSGNPAPTTIALTSAPAGMTWTTDTTNTTAYSLKGTITWTPTVVGANAGLNTVTITAGNGTQSTPQTWKLRVIPAPSSALIDGKNALSQSINVMCMGDSITLGALCTVGSYRTTMFKMLNNIGYLAVAQGGSKENGGNVPGDTVNISHEGHGGWTAFTYGGGSAPGYHSLVSIVDGTLDMSATATPDTLSRCTSNTVIATYNPDVVILMAGTNDIANGPYHGSNIHIVEAANLDDRANDHLGRLISAIWTTNPATRIIVLPILHNTATCAVAAGPTNNVTNTTADQDTWNIGTGITVNSALVARA